MNTQHFFLVVSMLLFLWPCPDLVSQSDSLSAEEMYDRAGAYYAAQKYDSAITLIDQSIAIFDQLKSHTRFMDASGAKAQYVLMRDGSEAAVAVLDEATVLANEKVSAYHEGWAEIYYQYGNAYQQKGMHDEAKVYAEKGIELCEKGELPAGKQARLEWSAARVYNSHRQLAKAKEYAYAAKASYLEAHPDTSEHFYGVITTLADVYMWESEYDSAIYYSTINLAGLLKQYGPDHFNVGVGYNQIAGIYNNLDRFGEAIESYQKAIHIFTQYKERTGQYIYENIVRTNLSLLYMDLYEYEVAENYALQNLPGDIAYYGRHGINLLFTLGRLITINHAQKEYAEAQKYIDHVQEILEHDPDMSYANQCYILNFLLAHAIRLKNVPEARNYFREYQRTYAQSGEKVHKVYVSTIAEMGNLFCDVGQIDSCIYYNNLAISLYKQLFPIQNDAIVNQYIQKSGHLIEHDLEQAALMLDSSLICLFYPDRHGDFADYLKKSPPNPVLINVFSTRLNLLVAGKESNPSNGALIEQIALLYDDFIENYYAAIRSKSRLNDLAAINDKIYGLIVQHYIAEDKIEKAFEYAEKSRSLSIRLALNQYESESYSSLPEELRLKETKYIRDLQDLNISRFENADSSENMGTAYLDLMEAYYDFRQMLKREHPEYYRMKYAIDALDLETIRSALGDNQSLISYRLIDSTLYAFILSGERLDLHRFSDGMPAEQILGFSSALNTGRFDEVIAKNIYARVFSPLEDFIQTEELIIVPDDLLNHLSFDLLLNHESQLLLEKHTISTAIATDLIFSQTPKRKKNSWISFAPGFSDEIKDAYVNSVDSSGQIDSAYLTYLRQPNTLRFSAALPEISETQTYNGLEATEDLFKNTPIDAPLIFIGTHAEVNDERPAFSRLVMAKSTDSLTRNDGYLHAYELYTKEMSTDLAILSACNTGAGQLKKGEGILSLSHAFSYAGCPSILMTKWNVDEKTTMTIVEHFLRNIKNGMAKNRALADAKKTFIAEAPTELKDPYYWAGLQLIGDPSPIYGRGMQWWMWGLGLAIFALLIYVISNRRK